MKKIIILLSAIVATIAYTVDLSTFDRLTVCKSDGWMRSWLGLSNPVSAKAQQNHQFDSRRAVVVGAMEILPSPIWPRHIFPSDPVSKIRLVSLNWNSDSNTETPTKVTAYRMFPARDDYRLLSELTRLQRTRFGTDTLAQILRRPEINYGDLPNRNTELSQDEIQQVEIAIKSQP